MIGIGAVTTVITIRNRRPAAVPVALGYFTFMEALQAAGYLVVDDCASPANQSLTLLSYLHIAFHPFIINAFALELVPARVRQRVAAWVYGACAFSAAVMLTQLYPFAWAGSCRPGETLCAAELCLRSGDWHIAWDVPYNGLMVPFENWLGASSPFPTYLITVFILPFAYGAWRFVLLHLAAGPALASLLTSDPNEMPAVWCLFSIGIVLISLSPKLSNAFSTDAWGLWKGIERH
jgi:hypothetical protein